MAESARNSVTGMFDELRNGSEDAARELWGRYFEKLVALARKRLGSAPKRARDEEDVALSVFRTLCRGAAEGRFDGVADRHQLWHLLLLITRRKSVNAVKHELRAKRGGGRVEAATDLGRDDGHVFDLDAFASTDPTPETLAAMNEQFARLLESLRDDVLRAVVVLRMEGGTVEEIAGELGVVPRTIERKLKLVRTKWAREVER